MEQHPVPQQISSYHFRLVGDMTLKQFLELIIGIVAAWVFYSLPIPSFIRWPMVILSVFSGVAFAFLPLEDRPLDKWLASFVKAVYSPTQFVWKKKTVFPHFFQEIPKRKKQEKETEQVDRRKLKAYLESLPSQTPQTAIDAQENRFISDIMKMYTQVQPMVKEEYKPKKILPKKEEEAPEVKVRVRKLKSPPLDPSAILRGEIIMPKRHRLRPKKVDIPIVKPIVIDTDTKLVEDKKEEVSQVTSPAYDSSQISPTGSVKADKQPYTTVSASLQSKLPIPTPSTPNVLVGMVLDNSGNIVENAIVTIRDSEGNVARAQKTNKLGQFYIATPLKNGKYEIEIEREDLSFDIININLEGKIVPPIEVKSKATVN